jgi:adenylosuccinate synthase
MKKSFVLAGLGFGDEGKGSVVDWLVREHNIKMVCRYNGGFQAAHNVVTPEGVHHTFSQYGSGTLASDDVRTVIFSPVIVNPMSFLEERDILRSKGVNTANRVIVSSRCRIATPFHAVLNRVYEVCRGNDRHGSCGQGIGIVAKADEGQCMYVEDLSCSKKAIAIKMEYIRGLVMNRITTHRYGRGDYELYIHEQIGKLCKMDIPAIVDQYLEFYDEVEVMAGDDVSLLADSSHVFEGAQGVLLDEKHGFFPHVTKSNATFDNALMLLDTARFDGEIVKVGVIRAYHTRHGNGPFPSESEFLTEMNCMQEEHNSKGEWQGAFRIGHLDIVLVKYALDVVDGVDMLVVTNVDRLYGLENNFCYAYKGSHLDFFKGTVETTGLVVSPNMDENDHHVRNEFLNGAIMVKACGERICNGNDKEGLREFLWDLENKIGRNVDVMSVSPTCEGKFYPKKIKEAVNG